MAVGTAEKNAGNYYHYPGCRCGDRYPDQCELGPTILKCLKVEDPVAIGLALRGTGHAVGTGTAFQYGQVAGLWVA